MKAKEPKKKYRIQWNFSGLTISLDQPESSVDTIEQRNKAEIKSLAVKALRDTADRIERDSYSSSLGNVLRRDTIYTLGFGLGDTRFEDQKSFGDFKETTF